MRIPGRLYIWWHRTQNRYWDARAMLSGFCNHKPWSPIPGEGGGTYAHWRCALKRNHDGLHRARNYVWTDSGDADYFPVPTGLPVPSQPWTRHMMGTRREDRQRDAWLESRYAGILAAKSKDHS